ncbi:MAG: hypothetical protein QN122_12925 [Armatimonadota bacterium]|nr:hypothetical protein [Armatimonadota bacterium]MDR7447572.1 hypothetical protein [Armatimonadota bacterium]MDR7458738.1 hypothetical protein [Armatimonadota bacterium]MDR7480525.1 hypothetical protein [Armatimonadota bacterium]MDR7489328.1 hypothetical protein [Armatimonadota bacterium]
MSEREAIVLFVILLGAMVVVGAALPVLAPGLIRLLDRTVLKEEPNEEH